VIWQKYAVVTTLSLLFIGISGCADHGTKYRDTSELEKPPELEIVNSTAEPSSNAAKANDSAPQPANETKTTDNATPASETDKDKNKAANAVEKGLGDVVKLTDDSHLLLILSFDEAWKQVKNALPLASMEISDRNREKGQYYVEFDLDNADLKNGEKPGLLSSLFNEDNYPKARYLLTFTDSSAGTAVKAEFLEFTSSQADDQTDTFPADKGVSIMLKKLYSALHDDVPLK
jgi:uncharacterized lipoprotein